MASASAAVYAAKHGGRNRVIGAVSSPVRELAAVA